ncbi:MAG: ATP-binding protein [Hyphomicrobium sp.]
MRDNGVHSKIERVSIRPGVSVLSILRHLNYRPWFALAEFVDNALQSYLVNEAALRQIHGAGYRLAVHIDIEPGPPAMLKVRDNAAGISAAHYPRAFKPAEIPPDQTGLSEFGMGMKSAACWFAPRWHVRTSALGEPVQRNIHFDIEQIVHDRLEELAISETPAPAAEHFTEIVLEQPYRLPVKKTIGKIKEHLADIYRTFIRDGTLDLRFDGEPLQFQEPAVLTAPYYKEPGGKAREWRKPIDFDFGNGQKVRGFAAIRETGNVSRSGFALFRRGRLIEGSGDEGYRPEPIFGKSNSFRYQRIFGELHLDGFEVSHTKDGFQWDENEGPFIGLLDEHLDSGDLPLLRQAEGYRARPARNALLANATQAVETTAEDIATKLPDALPEIAAQPDQATRDEPLEDSKPLAAKELSITYQGKPWHISIEITDDRMESEWLAISSVTFDSDGGRRLQLRLSAAHPFMIRFAQRDSETMEALLRVAAALAISEVLFKSSASKLPGTIRRNVNELLLEVFSDS